MARPKIKRYNCCRPVCTCFKPEGMPHGTGLTLGDDELTAVKLHDICGMDQKKASKKMGISQPTFARILASSRKKLASAVVEGRIINICGCK